MMSYKDLSEARTKYTAKEKLPRAKKNAVVSIKIMRQKRVSPEPRGNMARVTEPWRAPVARMY
jgi:hypothetical protein